MNLDEKEMRVRFHELLATRDDVYASAEPLRAEYAALQDQIDALMGEQDEISAKIEEATAPAAGAQKEMAMICRALAGNTAIEVE